MALRVPCGDSNPKRFLVLSLEYVGLIQGGKRNPNPNFLVRIFSSGVGVFHVNGLGAKKFDTSLETRDVSNFLGGISRDFAGISRRCPKSLRKKSLCSISVLSLECRKWGFRRWGFKQIRGYLRKKRLFPPFSGFSRCSSHPLEKGEKGRKRAKKADFGRFPGRAARHPLSPHLLHPYLRQPNVRKTWGSQWKTSFASNKTSERNVPFCVRTHQNSFLIFVVPKRRK